MHFAFILQLVGLFSFLIRKRQSSQDYSTSDSRKLDMLFRLNPVDF